MRIKIIFSYDGSKFKGFQRQNSEKSIQKTLEDALSQVLNEEVLIKGSGRTDAGVHAYMQVAHTDINSNNNIKDLKRKLNNLLNPSINIKKVIKVNNFFHARLSVKKKKYIYKINIGPFDDKYINYVYQPQYRLNINEMKKASKYLLGIHDYQNFVSGKKDNYYTTIYKINFKVNKNILEVSFIGTGFYRYMIRNLMGALIEVGKCKIKPEVIKNMIKNPKSGNKLPTAPPEGLYLSKIWYK